MQIPQDLACQEFVELVTDYLEGVLSAELAAALEAHLEICDGCALYLGQMRLTVQALRGPRNGKLPPALRERLLKLVHSHRHRRSGES